jgi:hypothetical protein
MQKCILARDKSAVCRVGLLWVEESSNRRRGGNLDMKAVRREDVLALREVLLMIVNSVISVR